MIFLFIIPAFAGIANFVVPLMLGAEDMAFPRLNALSFWMLPTAGVIMVLSLLWGGFNTGWTGYATLSTHDPTDQGTFFNMGVQFAGTSSILTAVNFIVTILTMRAPGMTLLAHAAARLGQPDDVRARRARHSRSSRPRSSWSCSTASCTRTSSTSPRAASTIMYQHIFWFYSHPAVYIMMLPGLRHHQRGHIR